MTEHQDNRDEATAHALAGDLRALIGQFKRMFRDQASLGDMTLSQVSVLGRLDRDGPATVTNLARADGIRPQSMGATVSALETAGLVSGAPDPNDGRQTIWSLTPACRERIRVGRVAREDWLFHVIQKKLSAAEQEQLANGLALLKRLTES
ncbi:MULTISPECIES: MarR family winged helix-turn-helix transcriptional regulator [Bradyrhizobium]|jgi:DNA-binding MarR family transcriptional regulator|uniref:Transcriptional regulator, MarR family n=2 Tax=Bradyrhizobium TaxID=374 RepID=A0ABY0PV82_9BRAD|nr:MULTISPECIES: MarR family transcriptional regulator [Bradyrhizobium]SDI98626.1 transcriptional regulator, MarR family [Bradyrhizobium ottawaense]SED03421.1 transcriptional regulator, MarR family [Bradyrhizobium lablabi]SHL10256.1 transcriptional regulator, MarR family [Bradyrhizobium lablabi]